jgi:hypothetical protein
MSADWALHLKLARTGRETGTQKRLGSGRFPQKRAIPDNEEI